VDHLARSLGNGLVQTAIDRAAEVRIRDDRLQALADAPESRILPLCRDRNLVAGRGALRAVWLSPGQLDLPGSEALVFLGLLDGQAVFTVDLQEDDSRLAALGEHGRFEELRSVAGCLSERDVSMLAYARGMCFWRRRHQYCGACGGATRPERGGHVRRCSNEACRASHFPRTDPAIIVLVSSADRCLLGHKPEWPEGRFSTIAGFVEPGEAVEQAVVREVYEETAVAVAEVSYHSSQPWPFPGAVMLGFHARAAATDAIELLDGELGEARWFHREEVGRALAREGSLRLPPGVSIARRLIEDWYYHGPL